jgi:bacterioferritin-associated ferredoxin
MVRRSRAVTVVCRCEEVTDVQIRQAIRDGHHTLEAVKRVLRTGMGHCQGRGCLKLIARMIERETGVPAADQKLPTSRPPLKPLPLGVLGKAGDEPDR